MNNKLDTAVDNFKNNTKGTDETKKTTLKAVNEYMSEFLKVEFTKLELGINEKLKNFNTSIDMIVNRITSTEKKQLKVDTQLDTSVKIFKFLFGGGCVLTVINIIVAMVK